MYSKDSTHLIVNDLVQLFVDNLVLEQVQDVTKRWYQPDGQDEEQVIKKDRLWENLTYFTWANYTIFRDSKDGLFKCWYEDLNMVPGIYPAPLAHNSRQLYAYSKDGVNFIKPELGIYQVAGRKTNIVLGDEKYGSVHSASIIMDPYPSSQKYRFRTLFSHQWKDSGGARNRIETAHSQDGIHWTIDEHFPQFGISGPNLNDMSCLFYDEDAREFVQNTRHYLQWAGAVNLRNPYTKSFNGPYAIDNWALESRRRVWQSRSHDFIHWSEPILVVNTDDEDNLDESFYGMIQWKIGTIHLAFAGILHHVDNTIDVHLLVSRDGLRWKRTNKRQPFLTPRGEGYWDGYMRSISSPPIEVGDEMWLYAGASACTHDLWMCCNEGFVHPEHKDSEKIHLSLGLLKMRKDGFVSIDANAYREGTVVTRALVSLGTKLIINGRCRTGGSIRVEVADRYDEIIEPCTKDNCDPFSGDSVNHVITWRGSPEIPAANEERRVWRKLRFFLRNAELFSFRFADSKGRPLGEQDKQGTSA